MIYENHFALNRRPFSIAPNPEFLFASGQYQEALAALEFGMLHRGGFILLTGEVGTGKTTLCKYLLDHVPDNTELALVLHPQLDRLSLLQLVCREFGVAVCETDKEFILIEKLTEFLLQVYAKGGYSVLMIDEAQHLDRDVLELVRLLTNLETHEDKLLQIILLGQPELQQRLNQYDLRQLNQRFTARYHLTPLNFSQTAQYVNHRLKVAGGNEHTFSLFALLMLQMLSGGIPRLINLIADRCLMGAYANNKQCVGWWMVRQAAGEVLAKPSRFKKSYLAYPVLFFMLGFAFLKFGEVPLTHDETPAFLAQLFESNSSLNGNARCLPSNQCWQGRLPSELLPQSQASTLLNYNGQWLTLSQWQQNKGVGNVGGGLLQVKMDWQLPYAMDSLVKPFDRHKLVPWVRSVLASFTAENAQVVSDDWQNWQVIKPEVSKPAVVEAFYYDGFLMEQVKGFQSQFDLTVDGVLGQQTLMSLALFEKQNKQNLHSSGGL